MEMSRRKKFVFFLLTVFIALCTVNLAEAGRYGGGHGHGGGYGHGGLSYVERLARYLMLDEVQVAHLNAVVELKKAQRESAERKAARDAVYEAAYAEVFSSFNYTAAVQALSDLKSANAAALAAVKAVFLESLSAEQRALLARIRRYHH